MQTTEELQRASSSWLDAATDLIAVAELAAPEEPSVFGELSVTPSNETLNEAVEARTDALLRESEAVVAEIEQETRTDEDARTRMLAILVGNLETCDALLVASGEPSDVFGELSVDAGPITFQRHRDSLEEFAAVMRGRRGIAGASTEVPASLATELEELEDEAGKEVVELTKTAAVTYGGQALLNGLDKVLTGAAGAAFDQVRDYLKGLMNAVKAAVVRISKWVVEQVTKLLPKPLAEKVTEALESVKDKLGESAPDVVGDVLGRALGRPTAERAWQEAADGGKDLTDATAALGTITDPHLQRLGWVTKARGYADKWEGKVIATVVGAAGPYAELAYAALISAIFAFVGLQVWDGCNDIEALVQ